ncbi:hypothetical protein [Luteimicrobium subarcticum]|uniref:Ig-like domain-containing protein n=1 Tax=Luteimicrobium subarcticum TaxID=620910 RepID=A0A2M8WV38_9MICO|nr:hypothetical protein [Luteimicrobium subarcticum]PJI94791.1 hypothetical protein CLV34_0639 [Luteimicrobium subarcticum]
MRRPASLALATALLASVAVVPALVAGPAQASTAHRCTVTLSTTKPKQYSSTTVRVSHVGARAKVTVQAKYKTTTNTKHATATSTGRATVTYSISGATVGRKVPVSVTATSGRSTWTCSTSFTPQHR